MFRRRAISDLLKTDTVQFPDFRRVLGRGGGHRGLPSWLDPAPR